MSNLIKFAVEFGSSAKLRAMTEQELVEAMQSYELSLEEQAAILSREPKRLADLGNGDVYCILFPEKPGEEDEEEPTPEKEDTTKVA
ncbi:hypothetical protein DU002_02650 [Corallincola holothuriorum]|uniref:Uncharacterized protein n=1 Tax=Corallincola holothuriorum TaxID=2282215 RepID=A0A368NUJ4_9GAMM|nr:hypothetical protein [Corallincola holothuriorum]RCU52881.1 hypothetical protein DU002_02650 [Corallincola holothuriorum]